MKSILPALTFLFFFSIAANAQAGFKVYDSELDGEYQIATAVQEAAASGKHVLVQVGGNWCKWCRKLHALMERDTALSAELAKEYVLVYLNYSKENQNLPALMRLERPERFGFPVLVVLDAQGKRLHTQDSALLESGDGHDSEKVMRFLTLWGPGKTRPKPDGE